ncbi:MAG: flippase-like domain-containing protein [Chitinivibrionales bacterium]|nr:flippase-like domain-containing protein [Chitinivibrionales bacterium]
MKKNIRRAIGAVVLIVAIGWAVHGVDFETVFQTWGNANQWLLLAVLGLTSADLLLRALAWKVTIDPMKHAPLKHVLPSYLIGMFSNVVLPLKLGDVAGSYYLGRSEHMSKAAVLSTAVIQRVFEGFTLLFVIVWVAMLSSLPFLVQRGMVLFAVVVASAGGIMYAAVVNRQRIVRIVTFVLKRHLRRFSEQVPELLHSMFLGATAIRNARVVITIVLLHLCSWSVQIAMVKLTADALHIELDVLAAAVVLIVVNIGIMIPLSPGNLGTYQLLFILALSLFTVGKSRALGFGVLYQVVQGVPVVVGGALSLLLATMRGNDDEPDLGNLPGRTRFNRQVGD